MENATICYCYYKARITSGELLTVGVEDNVPSATEDRETKKEGGLKKQENSFHSSKDATLLLPPHFVIKPCLS